MAILVCFGRGISNEIGRYGAPDDVAYRGAIATSLPLLAAVDPLEAGSHAA